MCKHCDALAAAMDDARASLSPCVLSSIATAIAVVRPGISVGVVIELPTLVDGGVRAPAWLVAVGEMAIGKVRQALIEARAQVDLGE